MSPQVQLPIAFFITAHGFGHAARAASVMEALFARNPAVRFEIFTGIPPWFFEDSLSAPFTVHETFTDVGLVQTSAMVEDISATVDLLDDFLPFAEERVSELCEQVQQQECRCIICDISPLGIHVAREANIPSILIENFTWDWIYKGYMAENKRLQPHMDYLKQIVSLADIHIKTRPLCLSQPVDFTAGPASRKPRKSRLKTRRDLGIDDHRPMVLITMGGIPESYGFLDRLKQHPDIFFVIPGPFESVAIKGNMALMPHRSEFYHPDLVNAADTVIGKAGYSTVAEIYHAGIPFAYVLRSGFPESAPMAKFIDKTIPGRRIQPQAFESGDWLNDIHPLCITPRINRQKPNGADQIAEFILNQLN